MKKLFLIIGAPGSGKTTDATLIAKKNKNIIHFSTGDMLREEVAKETKLGKEINNFIIKGSLVPLDIIINTIISAIENSKEEIILIDGYPRSTEQMKALNEILKDKKDISLLNVMEVRVSEKVAKDRVIGRVSESKDIREDDNMEIFKNRMKVYTNPLEEIENFYINKEIFKVINGERNLEEVVEEMNSFILNISKNIDKI